MIFLTVGTQFPFDRLVKAIDDLTGSGDIQEEIFAQIGESSYKPANFDYVSHLEKQRFDDCAQKASAIISHAGMGTIALAMENDKPLLVMPRLAKYAEAVNDHQFAIAEKFGRLGHILTAYNVRELPAKIKELKTFVPEKREIQVEAVIQRVSVFLNRLSAANK